jgi:hypothetical protein
MQEVNTVTKCLKSINSEYGNCRNIIILWSRIGTQQSRETAAPRWSAMRLYKDLQVNLSFSSLLFSLLPWCNKELMQGGHQRKTLGRSQQTSSKRHSTADCKPLQKLVNSFRQEEIVVNKSNSYQNP